MDNETPADHSQLGWTVGSCTCLGDMAKALMDDAHMGMLKKV